MMQWLQTVVKLLVGSPPTAMEAARSPQWDRVRDQFIKVNPRCELCGGKDNLEVHHCSPYHLDPARELDTTNLMTLCRPHHLTCGHLEKWESINVDARQDAATWLKKIRGRP